MQTACRSIQGNDIGQRACVCMSALSLLPEHAEGPDLLLVPGMLCTLLFLLLKFCCHLVQHLLHNTGHLVTELLFGNLYMQSQTSC